MTRATGRGYQVPSRNGESTMAAVWGVGTIFNHPTLAGVYMTMGNYGATITAAFADDQVQPADLSGRVFTYATVH